MSNQIEMISLEDLVPANHQHRRFIEVFDFAKIKHHLKSVEKDANYKGYGVDRLFRCLLLQFMENISDRELERMIQENNSAKWFCGFTLSEATPDFSVFSRARSRIGTNKLSKIFSLLRDQMRRKGFMSEVFTFVDASHLVSKATLWEERDALIKQKYDKINNDNISKVTHDKQAKIGYKGGGAVYADKGYCKKPSIIAAKRKNVHLCAIKNNNMRGKNHDLDRWITGIRSPYESVFSKQRRRVRYCGIAKNQFAEFTPYGYRGERHLL